MAITFQSQPDNYSPVYTNSMPFIVQSAQQFNENYKYLFSVNILGVAQPILIATYPDPSGQGIYSPHFILQANCDTSVDPYIVVVKQNSASKREYFINIGEQYNPGATFADTDLSGSFLGLTFSTNIVGIFDTGDIIFIQKDNIGLNAWIDGTASITSITSNSSILTDKVIPFGFQISSLESGSITNVKRFGLTSSSKFGWNAARQPDDFSDFLGEYILDDITDKKLLTVYETAYTSNLTQKKPIYLGDYETLDFFIATYSFANFPIVYQTFVYYDAAGAVLGTDNTDSGFSEDGSYLRYVMPAGTQNIVDIGGNGAGFIGAGTLDSYEVIVGIGDGSTTTPDDDISLRFNYQITPNCRPYEVVRLTFLNKLGGYDFWNFNLVSKYKSNIKRTIIDRALGPIISLPRRGRDVIYSTAVENWRKSVV